MWVKCLTVGKGKNGNSKPLTDNYKQIRNISLLLEPNRWLRILIMFFYRNGYHYCDNQSNSAHNDGDILNSTHMSSFMFLLPEKDKFLSILVSIL